MGRGAHAAHAAYNESGTQALAVTDKINENEEIKSVFLTENDTTKQIIHGCNISEMTCSGKIESVNSERYKIFTPDENADMLGDIYLNFEMDSEITDFEFVDMAHSNSSYPLQELSQEDLTTSFSVAGAELKSMELDLTTREAPREESVTLNMRTVNKIKTFVITPDIIVQFAVGLGDTSNGPNVAWRIFNKNTNEYQSWYCFSVAQFIEINDIIFDPLYDGNPSNPSGQKGSIILGGLLKKDRRRTDSGLYFMNIVDFNFSNPSSWTYDSSLLYNLAIPKVHGNAAQMYYVTVNTLTYITGSEGFIVSGRKSLLPDELGVVDPEYGDISSTNRYAFSASQTSKIFRNDSSDYSQYITDNLIFDLIHNGAEADKQKFTSNPEVTSALRIVEGGIPKTVLSCGSRFNTILGLDKDGLIIKSYDNGKTWEYSDFYYGGDEAENNNEAGVYRRSAAFGETFDRGTYVDYSTGVTGGQDPVFKYFMPRVSQLHTNDTGVWTAIGQQGIQPASAQGDERYRQFVFRSIDEGRTWHPIRLHTFPNKREIQHVQFNSIDIEYISIYTTNREACKILMSVPPETVMAKVFVRSGWAEHWSVTPEADLQASNADAVPGKSYVLLTVPSTLSLPWLGGVGFGTPDSIVLASLRSTSHRLIPWYGYVDDSNNSGLYLLRDGLGGNSNSVCRYEYLGAISDGKREILFGKNKQGIGVDEKEIGIVTILATRDDPKDQDTLAPNYHWRYPIETITVKLGKRRIIQNIVTTFLGMTAVLKNSNSNELTYEIIQSYNGLEWKNLIDIDNSTEVPIIQSDITGNIIYSYRAVNESYYKIFKITSTGEKSEINVLNNKFTVVEGLNYAGTEWLITGTVGDAPPVNVIVKSYDTVKWRKPNIDTNNYPLISSIVIKEKRLYEPLVNLPDIGGTTTHFKKGNFKTYEVCHSDYTTNYQGLGLRVYGMQDLNFSHGKSYTDYLNQSVKINSLDGTITNSSTTSANDILQLRDGTIIMCGESTYLNDVGDYAVRKVEAGHDYIVLAEGPGADGLTFTEASSIYKPSGGGNYMGISNFASTFYSIHEIQFPGSNHLAIGKNLHGADPISDGLLALRYIPDSREFTDLTPGGYYWKFIFGTNDPSITNNTAGTWTGTPFETIHDVFTNNLREIVVVGKPKDPAETQRSRTSPIFFEKPDNETFKTFREDWYEVPIQYHGFSEVLSVCYTGTIWVFVGIPNPKWMRDGVEVESDSYGATNINDGKILAYTTDLSDPTKWVIEDFVRPPHLMRNPFNIIKTSDETDVYSPQYFDHVSEWRGNHVRPVNYKGKSGVIINVSFLGQVYGVSNRRLEEKVYFMYEMYNSDGYIKIEQNISFPEPRILYRDQNDDDTSIYKTDAHGGEQFRPTWETYIDGSLRTLLTTVYPSQFNQFVVDLNENNFVLRVYANPLTEDAFADNGTNWQRRYRKFITTDTFSLRNRIEGNCYKIEQVKNENFITGVNSARYLAVGKGISSPIVKSDDLINWTDVDVKDIFTIVFDISHKSGLWVAIGEGNYNLAISKDGKNWTGIYTKYQSDTLSSDYSTAFNSLDYYNNTDDNVTDVLPYIPEIKGIFLRNLSILRLFSRIEYHVGAQIWQTLTFDDIKAMLDTEFGAGEYAKLLKNCSTVNKNGSTKLTTWIPGFTKTLNSKLETFVNVSENGSFPSGLLKDQKLSIKVYYNNLENVIGNELTSSDMNNAVFDNFMNNTLIPCDRDPNYFIDSFLADNYGFQLGDKYQNVNGQFKLKFSTEIQRLRLYCKQFELDEVEIDDFNKGVKQVPKITQSLYFDADNTKNMLLDLDNFNMYASHIIVSGWLTSEICITDMNLELNGYSYNKTFEPSAIDFATKLCLGLNYNRYTFNGVDKEDGIGSLVIPLASTAYSGSSVPLDRYSSIRLKLNFNAIAGPRSYINVTCVGTTTVSYNNSTANIDLF